MSFLPNVFSDPALKTRQDQLDGQWNSLWSLYNSCDQTPDQSFAEFATDRNGWKEFYDSGSDWSDNSKRATDLWQIKAQEWAQKLTSWGCFGSAGPTDFGQPNGAAPTIKDPPPDSPGILDTLARPANEAASYLKTIGWVGVGFVILFTVALVYILTKGKASGYGVSIGGDS